MEVIEKAFFLNIYKIKLKNNNNKQQKQPFFVLLENHARTFRYRTSQIA